MCGSALTVLEEAQNQLGAGDEEMAFMTFKKYFDLVEAIRKQSSGYSQRLFIAGRLGDDSDISRQMDELERLKNRLNER